MEMTNNSKILIKHNNAIQENWKLKNRAKETETVTLKVFSGVLWLQIWNMIDSQRTRGQVYVSLVTWGEEVKESTWQWE